MKRTVVALFNSYGEAERAMSHALDAGFDRNAVSIMATANPGSRSMPASDSERANPRAGAAVGGIAGAALGLTALAIPGVGPVIAAGPIAAALGATGVAASAGGLAGLLLGLGVTNDEAKTYATGVYDGGAVLAIHTDDAHEVEADHILRRFNAVRINCTTGMADERSAPDASDASRSHVEAGDPVALANTSDQPHKTDYGPAQYAPENPRYASSFDEFAGVFRRSHSVFFGARGDDYAAYREAYDFGYRAAGDRRAKKSWVEAEPDLRREWEELRGDWAAFRDAVHQGWEAARGSG